MLLIIIILLNLLLYNNSNNSNNNNNNNNNIGLIVQAHKEKCPNAPVLCSLHCGLRVPQHELTTHIESLCPKRPTACSHCGLTQTWDNLEVSTQ